MVVRLTPLVRPSRKSRRISVGSLRGVFGVSLGAFLAKLGTEMGNAVDTHGDIRVVGVVVFVASCSWECGVFFTTFVTGCLIFAMLPNRARLVTRIGLMVVFCRLSLRTAKEVAGTSIAHRSVRSAKRGKTEGEGGIGSASWKASEALSVEREPDGIKISNNTDQLARVQ